MSQLQVNLFQHIKNIMPANLSLVDEIADILEISNDSAYRRIRGEKEISFDEVQKLSNHFKISIDQILNLKNDSMLFSGNFVRPEQFDFLKYLDDQYVNLSYIEAFKEKVIIYFSKDIPLFYYYMFPEIAAFKSFAFMRTLLKFPNYAHSKFSLKEIPPEFFEKVKKIAQVVCRIPFIEVMNVENILTTLRQIEYYKDTGVFATKIEIDLLYTKLYEMIDHMENICAVGKKYMPGQKPLHADAVVKVYVNDFVIGDNSNIVVANDKKMCFINHNVMHFMLTQDEAFCNYSYHFMQNIIQKSNLISEVGERERAMFFNMIRQRIERYQKNEVNTLNKMIPHY